MHTNDIKKFQTKEHLSFYRIQTLSFIIKKILSEQQKNTTRNVNAQNKCVSTKLADRNYIRYQASKNNKKTHGASSSSLTRKNSTLKKNCTQNKYCRKIPLRLTKQETEVYLISRKQVHV